MVDQKLKKRAVHRAKILKGQVQGLISAIEKEKYCVELLRHSLSISRALCSLNRLLLENHLRTHVRQQLKHKNTDERAIKEIMEIFSLCERR
ncbi:metal-sensitive transcriptional regulator [Candidatus Uhrbacteria bacterium]|nr:metal-sensitive transcriptional regulator [Candidatus Uhrbacteria bacterium]